MWTKKGKNMEKILIVDKLPETYTSAFSSGLTAECFLMPDGHVYKRYFKHGKYSTFMKLFVGVENDTFIFPKQLIFLNEETEKNFKGVFTRYIEGSTVEDLSELTNMRDFLNALDIFEKQLLELSRRDVHITDVHSENMIYTKDKRLVAIDTDFYEFEVFYDISNTYKENIKELANYMVCPKFKLANIRDEKLRRLISRCAARGEVKPSHVLEEIKLDIERETKEEVKTLGDFNKGILLLK